MSIDLRTLFFDIYRSSNESELDKCLGHYLKDKSISWVPYGQNESFFGVIENQQASPIPALVEKITNSIDAILMRRCREDGIEPTSYMAPKTLDEAVKQFFQKSADWDLSGTRKRQAESIQIIADGPRLDTSLIIYDDGEGQHPDSFEATFLSLLRGNKNEIPFVQGKYNMGGAGAVVFCGKKRYQLVASKRFDNTGNFGFTLIRKHPLTEQEKKTKKNTWYEYLVVNKRIPSFQIQELDLGLLNRKFITGSIIKLYSYDLPPGSRSVISRDLNQSINEYLFEPALPIYTIDKKERYPKDENLARELYGLKRRMEEDRNKYIRQIISNTYKSSEIGDFKATIYVFNPKLEGKTVNESKATIRREFFKNNMHVMFSLNGQVQGHYTSEFITRSLKFQLLKDYLLIHVDCSNLKLEFRNELFMASRDRLKNGEESARLRKILTENLIKGDLKDIYKEWKDSITVNAESADELLKDFSKNLPLNNELMRLLNQTFNLDKLKGAAKKKKGEKLQESDIAKHEFSPKRYPTSFQIKTKSKNDEGMSLTKLPIGGDRTIQFSTDAEDNYFDRIDDPGELQIAVLSLGTNESTGGDKPGIPKDIEEIFSISHSSPNKGIIRVNIKPTKSLSVGDAVKVKASLTSPEDNIDQIFLVQITDKQYKKPKQSAKQTIRSDMGLPSLRKVYKKDWSTYDFCEFDYSKIMYPLVEGEKLDSIHINLDSTVLKKYIAQLTTEEQISVAQKRYLSSVYFHTIFLYMITKNRKYRIKKSLSDNRGNEDVELGDYLMDIFDSYYSEFLLNFEMSALIESLS
ncbi:MAG: hypothetical protein OXC41_00265 [Gammaproteobacteria bacterium]|nr:hypothetical protein [Gammaproteobacteria bacterium]